MCVAIRQRRRVFLISMRTRLNLSRRPFTNRRPFWLGVFTLLLLSGLFFVWITGQRVEANAKAQELQRQINDRQRSVDELQKQLASKKVEAPLTQLTPEQTYQLAAARQLITLRSFSWNRLLSDIEKYVPDNAKIVSIKIQEADKSNDTAQAAVEIKAAGKAAAQMTEMMGKLEHSGGLFAIDQATQDATDETGIVPFTLKLTYRPFRGNEGGEGQ